MDRSFYLDLAARGLRVPVATHLVLQEKADPEAILVDGKRLAAVMTETACRFGLPLALPVMDLTLEKEVLLGALGISRASAGAFHVDESPAPDRAAAIGPGLDVLAHPRMKANRDAIEEIARAGELLPLGMSIGPFSLATKLLRDPIVPIYLAGTGLGPEEAEELRLFEEVLVLSERTIRETVASQIAAGAKAVFVCEPAANAVYFSPKQFLEDDSTWRRFVVEPNLRLKAFLRERDVDLIFHDCGELIPGMVASFAVLDPVILSLGSPVKLWEMESFVPRRTVLMGNLPTKKFYSDEEVPLDRVAAMADEIRDRLAPSGHPFLIGSECDILSMPGFERTIMAKVRRFACCEERSR